jgi:ataxia telangiectasia mutated family protein
LKAKTVEAVLDHIIQTLPQADGEYFTELAPYYFKALNSLCEHKPNVERLKATKWAEVIEFCVDGINHYMDGMESEPSGLTRSFSALGTSSMSGSLAKSSLGNGHSQSKSRSISRQNVDELLNALFALVSAPNVSLLETAEEVATCALRFLASQISAVSSSHQLAFSIINAVLFSCREDRSSLLQVIAQDSIPIISRFWQGRITAHDQMLNSVRDEVLVLIFTVHLHLERSLLDQTTPDLAARVLSFLEVLRLEYSRRSSRDQLQLNDLNIIDPGGNIPDIVPFRLNNICLRSTENRAESNWANLRVIGLLERLISQDSEQKKPAADEYSKGEAGKHPRKRQRTSRHADRLIDPLKSEDPNVRLAGLQILPFVLQECQLSAEALNDLLQYLSICASDKKGHIASWALISIAR